MVYVVTELARASVLSQLLYGDYLVFITHTGQSGIIGKGKCVKSVAVW